MDIRSQITGLLGCSLPTGDGHSTVRSSWRSALLDEHDMIVVWRDHMDFHETYHLTPVVDLPAALDEVERLAEDDEIVPVAIVDLNAVDLTHAWMHLRSRYAIDGTTSTPAVGLGVHQGLTEAVDRGNLAHTLHGERRA